MKMKIAIASDHAGYEYKEVLKSHLEIKGFSVEDFGTHSVEPVDYPDFIRPAATSVAAGSSSLGIIVGGSGNEAIVANRFKGVRCAVVWNDQTARLSKEHGDCNMIAIGQRMMSKDEAVSIVETWLSAEFKGGRHQRRIGKIDGGQGSEQIGALNRMGWRAQSASGRHVMQEVNEAISFSTDGDRMDLDFITDYLSNHAYWAKGRTREVVERTVRNSFSMAIFKSERQIGFGRIVTDYETHGYVMDVFIAPSLQGRGYGRLLMKEILEHPALKRVKRFMLRTQDAKAFYEALGFEKSLVEVLVYEPDEKHNKRMESNG